MFHSHDSFGIFRCVRYPPVQGAMPGTTLEVIPMEVRHVFCVSWPG